MQKTLRDLFNSAKSAALADKPIKEILASLAETKPNNINRIHVIGCGKAAGAMAHSVEKYLDEQWLNKLSGIVVVPYGHAPASADAKTKRIEILQAAHPVPDENGVKASQKMLDSLSSLGEGDLCLALISGGGSSVLCLPQAGLELQEKQQLTQQLLHCGASIKEINCIRKALSRTKAGRLCQAAWPAKMISLIVSDVAGDNPSDIASGPTIAEIAKHDNTTQDRPLEIIKRLGLSVSENVQAILQNETLAAPPASHPCFKRSASYIVASAWISLQAAADTARGLGIEPFIISDRLEGEAEQVAGMLGAIAIQIHKQPAPFKLPMVILSGGECTVKVKNKNGRGGRNSHFMLALALYLQAQSKEAQDKIFAIACDTDGIDGSEKNAGAVIGPDTLARADKLKLNAKELLQENLSYDFFEKLGDLVISGPTLTNVNDFRAIIIV